MTKLNPSMRLKVKGDTFFFPDSEGSVYFRNNVGSFQMEGSMIDRWVEKLIPMFNGEYTLEELTDGLPDEYQDRVYEIAESLYQNGFVRDVSQNRPHQLPDEIANKYAFQIEFLDNLGGSGAYRFQSFRHAKVLAVGSGPSFVSLVAALLEAGLPKFHMLITDAVPTNRQRLVELEAHARKSDAEVAIQEDALESKTASSWRKAVQPFDFILYVSQDGDVGDIRVLHQVCKEEGKVLLPAMYVEQVGLAGPLVHPDSEGCWESAWRRVHQSAICKDPSVHAPSSTAGALLANMIVFELIKTVTGATESDMKNKFFLLNLETLEGNWHSFLPHPSVMGRTSGEWIQDLEKRLEQEADKDESNDLYSLFSSLTSAEAGIFHEWEERDLKQLPLSQCCVQAVDPLSEGPAELLPEIVCTGLTHEEARREAGLAGIEAYASRLAGQEKFVGVGAGETVAEGVCRGLQKYLTEELVKQQMVQQPTVFCVELSEVKDERCQFYLQALTTLQGTPVIGLGAELFGFPVVWVGTNDGWQFGVDLNVTLALRKALQHVLLLAQNQSVLHTKQTLTPVVLDEMNLQSLVIPVCGESSYPEVLQSALQVLKRNGLELFVCDLTLEPSLKEELAGVFGVSLREEEPR